MKKHKNIIRNIVPSSKNIYPPTPLSVPRHSIISSFVPGALFIIIYPRYCTHNITFTYPFARSFFRNAMFLGR